jgi:hypothetical protein
MTEMPVADAQLLRFVRLSMPLTGFPIYDLYGTGMARLYLDTALSQVGSPQVEEFLDAWERALRANDPLAELSPLHREIARAVVYLWYTGSWPRLAPAAHAALRRQVPNDEFVASPSSYPEGLVWRAFGAHPAGAKPPGFGTWADPPVTLPTEEEIREELQAGGESAEAPLTIAAYRADLSADNMPAHLLPGTRRSRLVPPSAVQSAASLLVPKPREEGA